jgi:hypothetical protein
MLLALVQADTHVLALELIVFVNDRQDATQPASAAGRSDGKHAAPGRKAPCRTSLTDRVIGSNGLGINTNGAERSNVIGSRGARS